MFIFDKPLDFLAIGDITTDAFIKLKEAHIHCDVDTNACEISMKFADKIPYEDVYIVKGVGNSPNAAVSAARLGLSSGLIANIGDDQNGKECVDELKKNKVHIQYIKKHAGKQTNYHYVLWYGAERTILVKHQEYEYLLPTINPPKWIYLSSLASNTENYHHALVAWLKNNPNTKLAFQPGTFQMKLGLDRLRELYKRTEVYIVNVEEAQKILGITESDKKVLLKKVAELGPKIVCITDGPKGSYMYDGINSYFMPNYPDQKEPFERTGCGDAFASTFVSALIKGKTPLEALEWAPINPMSVVQYVGAQHGLLTQNELEEFLKRKPENYKPVLL
jgi:sugar/nucleoside kinase (ribokinase family)